MVDSVFLNRSLGPPTEDQYADGKAALVWDQLFIGDKTSRTRNYKTFLVELLKKKGCRRVLDVACGTGVDSVMLLEEGFEVTSVDGSDKMLKYALKTRWNRRKEEAFDKWMIEEANWLTLASDIHNLLDGGFDAVICLGNSFAHMTDELDQRIALQNFEKCVKPGGLLLIDHRNFDHILDTGNTPTKCIYYNSNYMTDIKTSLMYVNGKPIIIYMDYILDISLDWKMSIPNGNKDNDGPIKYQFRLSYYPHRLEVFKNMLQDTFSINCKHTIYGDFKLLEEVKTPAFFIHVVDKPLP